MVKKMRWQNGILQVNTGSGWKSYRTLPQGVRQPDYDIPKGSPGFSTFQFLLKSGWDIVPTINPTNYREFIRQTNKTPGNQDVLILGLIGEYGELVSNPSISEVGDCLWYAFALAETFDIHLEFNFQTSDQDNCWMTLAELSENLKKFLTYKTPPKDIEKLFYRFIECVMEYVPNWATIEDVVEANMSKLTKRQQEGTLTDVR